MANETPKNMWDDWSLEDMVRSLGSNTCPACGVYKQRARTFCGSCYHELPFTLRSSLYCRIGKGYRPAVLMAMKRLNVDIPHMGD